MRINVCRLVKPANHNMYLNWRTIIGAAVLKDGLINGLTRVKFC
ncbi:MAG: hypothetical protein JWR38_975 [Mucilaginibacter sp.]|nr:hypothetical protein [Mucilaginibacter sp.]